MKNIVALFLVCFTLQLSAQLNPEHIYVNAKEGVIDITSIQSQGAAPNFVVVPGNISNLSYDFVQNTQYDINLEPLPGFLGDLDVTIEYFEAGPFPGIFTPNYTTIHYRIKTSKIELGSDNLLSPSSGTNTFDVLANDNSSDGNLSLVKLGQVAGGTASIVNNQIEFTANSGTGKAYIRYFAEDNTGNIESSVLHLTIEDDSKIESKTFYTDQRSVLEIVASSANYAVSQAPQNGSLSQNGHIYQYSPNLGFTGTDNLILSSSNGGELTYTIEVLPKAINTSFVRDDSYAVITNGSITFDVFENDFRDEFNIIDHSPELTHLGNGQFSFSPNADFTGDLNFYYKIYAGFQFHVGNITIHVDDFAPTADYDYEFSILKEQSLRVDHNAPVEDYYFSLATAPINGTVDILDNNGSITLECDVISGDNVIVYTPDDGYNGLDEFDIEFCTTSGICEIIKIDVEILDSNNSDCLCLNNCVYKGDNNDDGAVNIKDVLDLALNIGQGGYERTNDFNLFWTGQDSEAWGYSQINSDSDLKCGDADGDGYIDYNDFVELEDNYGEVHSFVPNNVGIASDVPISFVPHSTDVDSGEWMFIDIVVGNAVNPAIDFYGTAFSFNINPDVIDSASVNFVLNEESFLAYQSPLYDFTKVPVDGQVDIAVSRISNIGVDLIDIIGTVEFIVEEELQGIKSANELLSGFNIRMEDIISVDANGTYRTHASQETFIKMNNGSREEENPLEGAFAVYPNPSTGLYQISSASYNIDGLEVYNALGQQIDIKSYRYANQTQLDLSAQADGIYFIRIQSQGETVTHKVHKLN